MHPRSALLAALVLSASVAYSQQVGLAVALDSNGNEYSIGIGLTPTSGAAQTQAGGGLCQHLAFLGGGTARQVLVSCVDAQITKRDSSGNVIFSTLLGGSTDDAASAIAIDGAGFTYIAGSTGGSFPVTANAALSTIPAGGNFAAKLSPDGSKFIYVTYLPATVQTVASLVADANGNAYLTGRTQSGHAFAIRINADGSSFVYNQAISISQIERGTAIAVDANGNAAVAGWTQAGSSSPQNVFVTKLDASGMMIATNVLPGSGVDTPNAIQLDSAGNVYLAGATTSTDFPATPGTFEPMAIVPLWSAVPGGFATKLAPDLSIAYSTYVPASYGAKSIGVTQLVLGPAGDVYLSGATGAGLAVTNTAMQPCFDPGSDLGSDPPPGSKSFVLHLDATGTLEDATYANGIQVLGLGLLSGGVLLVDSLAYVGDPAISRLAFRDPPGGCLSPIVVNSATFLGSEISAGGFVTLSGMRIGPDAGIGFTPDALGRPPLTLGGVQVLFDGQPAPLLYVQSRQINVLAPFELAGKTSTNITVKFNSSTFGPITVPVGIPEGGIFRRQPGVSADAVATNEDGSSNSPSNPAPRGSIVSFWGTGFGQTPGCVTGALNIPAAVSLTKPIPGFAGPFPPPAITYIGGAPTFLCGVEQINVRIPPDASPGPYTIHASQVASVIYVK